ncbi:hypothetical protein HYW60_03440 [Candidatus Kaiserbacteria bacterium]|nr:hypothetical protein [Candidatus Kaiserbacteria bacterium]
MNYPLRLLSTVAVLSLSLAIPSFTLAETIEGNIELPDTCTVLDKNGTSHTFPKQNSPSEFLAVCALAKALEVGTITSMQLSEFPDFGLFVEGLSGVIAGSDEFWALWLNGAFAECGIECLVLREGDTVSFILTSFEGEERGGSVILHITALSQTPETSPPPPSGGTYRPPPARPFELPDALAYLSSKQRSDGSFGSPLLTDWAAIALSAAGELADANVREKLRAYLSSSLLSDPSATDLERRTMALEALGIDPYAPSTSLGTSNYVDLLIGRFDGTQMGEVALVNDDIFAIFPLAHAGYGGDDAMMRAILDTIVKAQQADGSWVSSIDLTAAAIQALVPFHGHPGVSSALSKAEGYLRGRQVASGGFGQNSFSTSWVLQAIAALNQKPSDWNLFEITPLGHLGNMQQGDGGLESVSAPDDTRIWATTYAIPAALARPWHMILKDFSRPTAAATSTTSAEVIRPPILGIVSAPIQTSRPTPAALPSQTTSSEIERVATTTESTTTAQIAAVSQSTNESNSTWLWLSGLLLIIGGTFYFLRRT